MARPCPACTTKVNEEFDKAFRGGEPWGPLAIRLGVPRPLAQRHAAHLKAKMAAEAPRGVAGAPSKVTLPEPPPPGASPKDVAAWHVERIKARMMRAEETNAPPKEIAAYYGQLTNALRHHARLSGALDITEVQILRSAPWARVMAVVREALKKHPKAVLTLDKALEELEARGGM